jgi:heme exporter protein A
VARDAMTAHLTLAGKGVSCVRGGRNIFSDLNFSVSSGETLAVTGPNGSGKSSLLRQIAGLLLVDAGAITLSGASDDLSLPEQAHFLGHRDGVKPTLTALENIAFWFDFLGGGSSASSPSAALEAVGLGSLRHLPAAVLSAGQRRRLALARLIALKRPVWLLDEPTTALDDMAQAVIAGLMAEHLRGGGLIVAATHQPLGIAARELRLGSAQ